MIFEGKKKRIAREHPDKLNNKKKTYGDEFFGRFQLFCPYPWLLSYWFLWLLTESLFFYLCYIFVKSQWPPTRLPFVELLIMANLKKLIGVQLLYNVVLASAGQQSESAIHIHMSPFLDSHHRAVRTVLCGRSGWKA